MGNKMAFSNIDIDIMKEKLLYLDDVEDRIKSLSKLLNDDSISNIMPTAFTTIQPRVVNGTISSSSIVNLVKNGKTKISTKFTNDAVNIIGRIKILRDSIEWADMQSDEKMQTIARISGTKEQDGEVENPVGEFGNGGEEVYQKKYKIEKTVSLTLPNGQKLVVPAGEHNIVDYQYGENGELKAVAIMAGGNKVWIYLDENGNIEKYVVETNGVSYTVTTPVIYTLPDGTSITIPAGTYQVLEAVYNAAGELVQMTILVNGTKLVVEVKDGEIVGAISTEITEFNVKNGMNLKLPNGKTIIVAPGNYKVVDTIYGPDGKLQAVCIEVEGHRIWLYLDKNGNITQVKVIINNGKFTLDNDYKYADANGKSIQINSGVYPLLEAIYDANGNLIQVVILVNGNRVTIDIKNGKVVGVVKVEPATVKINKTMYAYASDGTLVEITPGEYKVLRYLYDKDGNIIAVVIEVAGKIVTLRYVNGNLVGINVKPSKYTLKVPITITLPDKTTLTINPGEYGIVDAIYDENGNITAVCIEKDGYKIWLYLDKDGNVTRVEYIKVTPGVFKITSPDLVVKDKFGNILDNVKPGDYYIYETRYDKDGNPIAVRISPDGEDEIWVYLNPNSKDDVLSYFNQSVQGNGGSLAMFEKNKNLLGVLGILFVTVGATMVIKKRKKKKKETEDVEEEWEDTDIALENGNYAVYEVAEDKDKHIKSARITPDDANEEYWVEM